MDNKEEIDEIFMKLEQIKAYTDLLYSYVAFNDEQAINPAAFELLKSLVVDLDKQVKHASNKNVVFISDR